MRHPTTRFPLLPAILSVAALAQSPIHEPKAASTKPFSPATDNFANEALVFERFETTMRMHADGTGEREVHVSMRLQSEGATRQFGVLSFAYASANEKPSIRLVRVHKTDGATIDTPAADAIEMPAAISREAPLYSDLKEKHVPVRSLSAGDTLEYDVSTTINKAEAPGQFWGANHFTPPGTLVVLSEVLTLEVPKDKYVQVWSPNHKPTVVEHDGLRTYVWRSSQLVPAPKTTDPAEDADRSTAPKDPDENADGRKLPSVAWTTFHTWAEVGDWYRSLALPRAQPGDALRARADEITKDAKTSEEQVRAIYSFVSSRTRYVGIDFGVGRYQPHTANEVLANQYGDCKDKDTLLEALLRAKGFTTAPALIGAGITPVPEVPSPAVFNHVITTVALPGGRIWLDSTPEVAPYQFLSPVIRDQQALIVPAKAPATLERTPATAPYLFVSRFEAVGQLDAEGKLTSHMTASYRTDDEIFVRSLARNVAPAEWDKASQLVSSNTGFGGTTSNTRFTRADDLSSPIVLTYDYSRHPFGDWENRRINPLFPALEFTMLASDKSAPPADIELGAPRTLNAVSRIRLPEGYRTDLPDAIHVKTDFATFEKTYRFDGKEITVERNIVVLKAKLPKSEWKKYQAFTKDISLEGEPWIQLLQSTQVFAPLTPTAKRDSTAKGNGDSGSTAAAVIAPPPTGVARGSETEPSDTSVQPLMQRFVEQMRARDMEGAKATLDKVKAQHPDTPHLWASYGGLAAFQRNYDEAKSDFEKELAANPEDASVVGMLSRLQKESGDSGVARQTLQSYLDRHPGELQVSLQLAYLQASREDNTGALKTMQIAAEHNPEDRLVRLQLGQALLRLDRKDEAAAAAKSVLDGSEDPNLLNNAGYVLAETGLDLPYAEEVSRRSISKLEEKSAAITTAEVNSNAFANTNLLIAAWDTLGWILFREEKPADARPWLVASWRNALRPEVGDHLGQMYEALGEKEEAASAYTLAEAAIAGENVTPAVRKHIAESIARLKGEDKKPTQGSGTQQLQNSRTYKLPRPAGVSGWGTFRLQITTSGVVGLQQMSGEQKLASIAQSIKAMTFPELVPPQSKAHLLRSAVVSCSAIESCELVLVPDSSLRTEQQE